MADGAGAGIRPAILVEVTRYAWGPADPARRRSARRLAEARASLAACAVVALVAWANFMVGLATPAGTIWDESYYLTSTQRYLEGTAQFASHPPLGLMLIAAGERISGANRGIDDHGLALDKTVDGRSIPAGYAFAGPRLAPAAFGVLGAIAFFFLMRSLTGRIATALAFSNLYLFENAFIVQFRAAQLDSFQVTFAIAALLCFVKAMQRGERASLWLDLALGAACGLATMVKVNAMVLVVLGLIVVLRRMRLAKAGAPSVLRGAIRDAATMAAGFLGVCAAVFALQVAIGPRAPDPATPAGAKDARYVTGAYDAYLHGRRGLSPAVVATAGADYARFMADDFKGVPRLDPNGSAPLSWPLGGGAINYRWDSDGVRTRYVQLAGNLAGGWIGLVSLIAAAVLAILPRPGRRSQADRLRRDLMVGLLVAYAAFMALHVYLGQMRVMYLYHYFIGLVLSFALAPLAFEEALSRWPAVRRADPLLQGGLIAALLASFLFYAPLSYNRPLDYPGCEARNLLRPVVACVRPLPGPGAAAAGPPAPGRP